MHHGAHNPGDRQHCRRYIDASPRNRASAVPGQRIDDLERVLPPGARGTLQIPRIEDVQALTCAILYGTEEDRARAYIRSHGCNRSCGTTRSSPNCQALTRSLADHRQLEAAHRTSEPISHSVHTPEESPTVLRAVDSTFFEVDAPTAIVDKLARKISKISHVLSPAASRD
jgi:hypothetical protein